MINAKQLSPLSDTPYYDRIAARGYADLWWNGYNPDYGNYAGMGGDCANFVSQCLIAGGISLWKGSDGNGAGLDYYTNQSGTLINCDDLAANLKTHQLTYYSFIENSGVPPDNLTVGDVIIYGTAGGDLYRHAVIVVEGNGSSCKVNAHSSSQYHVSWDYLFPSTYNRANFYHFLDKNITERIQFRVNTSALNVRIGPGTAPPYNIPLGKIKSNQEYIAYEYVINATGVKWWHFWYDYRNAWCCADFGFTTIANENIKFKVNVTTSLNVRAGPGTTHPIVNKTFNAQTFTAFELVRNGSLEWYRFWYRGRNDTWCAANYTTPIKDSILRTVSGWLPYWAWNSGISTFSNNIELFDEISPFWYKTNADGTLSSYSGAGNQTFVKFAHDNKVKVIPLISNGYNKTLVHTILSNPTIMENHIANITNLVISNNYDGIDIDYEGLYASDKDNFTLFISELAEKLHEKNKLLAVCVHAKWSDSITYDGPGAHDYENLGKFADTLRIMAYDEHWSTSEPGPIASYSWVEKILSYAVTKTSKDKIILGVPFYGRDWNKTTSGTWTSKSYTYPGIINLMTTKGATRAWNSTAKVPQFDYSDGAAEHQQHYVYYEDNQSLSFKLDLVIKYNVAGVCGFALGYEDPLAWSLSQKKISVGKSFVYYLNEGWNFITIPLSLSCTAETLAQNITNCTHISYWDVSSQKFVVYEKGSGINNFDLQTCVGYHVYVSTKSRINITGIAVTASVNLYKGWNSIGWCNFTATDAKSLARNITNCTAVAYWDNARRFVIHPVDSELANFPIERGSGYLVYVFTTTVFAT
ncbi:MAG: glycosyl hydrolase family 18 protein [Candidatus Thermoplasmatota archaeon]|nr:glycosyl hydrolase family 18 protein [Candidatus Thermoplasmatota archaeon]